MDVGNALPARGDDALGDRLVFLLAIWRVEEERPIDERVVEGKVERRAYENGREEEAVPDERVEPRDLGEAGRKLRRIELLVSGRSVQYEKEERATAVSENDSVMCETAGRLEARTFTSRRPSATAQAKETSWKQWNQSTF